MKLSVVLRSLFPLASLVPVTWLLAVPACGPLVNDPVDSGAATGSNSGSATGSGSGSSGSASTGASGDTTGGDSSSPASGSSGGTSGGTSGTGGGATGSTGTSGSSSGTGPTSGASTPGADASSPPPACPSASTTWSAGTGLSTSGWTVMASSTAAADLNGDSLQGAIDGNMSTRWSSGHPQMNGDTFTLNLGQATMISQVLLYLLPGEAGDESDAPVSYDLGLSTDGSAFSTVASGNGTVPTTVMCFPREEAQYIRITQTGTAAVAWWSINEIAVIP